MAVQYQKRAEYSGAVLGTIRVGPLGTAVNLQDAITAGGGTITTTDPYLANELARYAPLYRSGGDGELDEPLEASWRNGSFGRNLTDTETAVEVRKSNDLYPRWKVTADGLMYQGNGVGPPTLFVASGGSTVVDSSSSLTAAIAAGGKIAVMPGTYDLTSSVSLPANVHVWAVEPRLTTIRATASTGGAWNGLLNATGTVAQLSNITLDGLVVDANSQTNTPTLRAAGVANFKATNCVFKGTPSNFGLGSVLVIGGSTGGVSSLDADRVVFEGCEFGPNGDVGVSLWAGSGSTDETVHLETVKFINCYVHDNDHTGIQFAGYVKRCIRDVEVRGSRFERNALTQAAEANTGHIVDGFSRNGMVDLEVTGCEFREGSASCGAVADHQGRNTKIHGNHFEMGNVSGGFRGWTIALGEDRSAAVTSRTWFAKIHDNTFVDCGSWDFDSTRFTSVRGNTFYRNWGRPVGTFGHQYHTLIEGNEFIENGQGTSLDVYEHAGISCSRGVTIRGNTFRDDQGTKTQTDGIYELSGDPDEGQPPVVIVDNDFANTPTPLDNRQAYPHVISGNRADAAPTVTAAATVTLPCWGTYVAMSGATTVTAITLDKGRTVTIRNGGAATVTDGGTLDLAGNYTTNGNLTLTCDGSDWHETSRTGAI